MLQPLKLLALIPLLALPQILHAEMPDSHPTAILSFQEKGTQLAGMGDKIADIVFSQLVTRADISLVDRQELAKLQDEAVLNLSGMVNPQQANQIGQLTGARIIVTGTVFEIENNLMLVAKIIGTETSRVLGASVQGKAGDNIITLTELLSSQIADTISGKSALLVAKPVSRKSQVAALKQQLQAGEKPSLSINITEHHINRKSSDPAAEIEMTYYSTESGFEVIDKDSDKHKQAAILIVGEGFSEFATRKGDIVGVKARLEVKAIEQASGKVLAVDRQTELEVDLSEIIAAKKALQRASAKIALRLLPKLVSR